MFRPAPISLPQAALPFHQPPTPTFAQTPTSAPMTPSVALPPMRRTKQSNTTIPSRTLYLRNLNERKTPKVLTRNIQTIFSVYGKIKSISIKKNVSMKGQAFVVFEEMESAERAVREGQGVVLFDKVVDVQFSNDLSVTVAEVEGKLEALQKRREERKREREIKEKETRKPIQVREEYLAPNSILFVQNLPQETTREILASLFQQFPGFKEIRVVPGRSDIAFVEYESELLSSTAKIALHGFRVTADNEMKVSFAKK